MSIGSKSESKRLFLFLAMTSPVIAGVIFTFWMSFGMGYFTLPPVKRRITMGYYYGVFQKFRGISKYPIEIPPLFVWRHPMN